MIWSRGPLAAFAAAALSSLVACAPGGPFTTAQHANPTTSMSMVPNGPLGLDLMSYRWKHVTADRTQEIHPQEFAAASMAGDTVYVGSEAGTLLAMRALTGEVRWQKNIGSVSTAPLLARGSLYIGTDDGFMLCLDPQTGAERWRYGTQGAIEQPPTISGDVLLFANEADHVYGLDVLTGKFKWQWKVTTPDEYTLRGHAGIAAHGELVFTGFSDGTMAALRRDTGSVAWSTSLKGEGEKFVDVDSTPVVVGTTVYVVSSSGGVYALDEATGLVKWRVPLFDMSAPSETASSGTITTDGVRLYVAAANLGIYALDLDGNILWRQGTRGGGEPAQPVVQGELLLYSLAHQGLFIADRRTGVVEEYFDPGDGVSAAPTVTADGRLFVMSNRGVFYAFDLAQP